MNQEDRARADRIAVLSGRLWRLEEILNIVGDDSRTPQIGLKIGLAGNGIPAVPDVVLRGVEAVRVVASLKDDTTGEMQALL